MKFKKPKRLGWIITGVVTITLIILALLPKPMQVDVASVTSGLLQQTIDAEGRTRLRVKYLVTLPVTGTISRINLEPGDSLRAGQVIAYYTPPTLDARERASATSRAEAASTMEIEARNRLESLRPLLDQAKRRAERSERLHKEGAIPKDQAEAANDAYEQLQHEFEAAEARVKAAKYEAQAARSAIAAAPGQSVAITSPANGVVIRLFENQERMMMAGSPILEIVEYKGLDLVIDVLSTDAVRIKQGMKVLIEGWGGDDTLVAKVRTIEPAARVKVSSLGVEEKRVDVIADLTSAPAKLGDAYKVDARVVIWESDNVTIAPLSALFRDDGQWYVFRVVDGSAVKQQVQVGHRSGLTAEIVKGLAKGDQVIVHPPEDLKDGQSIEIRS